METIEEIKKQPLQRYFYLEEVIKQKFQSESKIHHAIIVIKKKSSCIYPSKPGLVLHKDEMINFPHEEDVICFDVMVTTLDYRSKDIDYEYSWIELSFYDENQNLIEQIKIDSPDDELIKPSTPFAL